MKSSDSNLPPPGSGPVDEHVVPVIEESIRVRRRVVDTGRALRVRKLVHEEAVEIDEPLQDEWFDAERVAVGRVVSGPVGIRHEGDVMIVPVVEERLVVRKELVLVEEIRITRRREVRHAREKVTLRRERVVIERFDSATQEWRVTNEGEVAPLTSAPDPPAPHL